MKKTYRILFYLILSLLLLSVTTQVFASPSLQDGTSTPTAKVPGGQATQKAIEKATKQADKPVKGKHENYKGTVTAISEGSISLTLRDESTVKVSLTADTRIKIPGFKGATTADIQVGMGAMVQAIRDQSGNLTARSIMVVPGKPTKAHRVGVVTAYSAGESITIEDKDGNAFTFLLGDTTKLLPADRAETLDVGSRVTIIAPRDPANSELTAQGIVIHPDTP